MSDGALHNCRIIRHEEAIPGRRELIVHAPELAKASIPGQFAHIRCGTSIDPLLRRPISIHDADPESGEVAFLYEVRGRGTELLSQKQVGDVLDVIGPLGNGFTLPESLERPLVLIAGGIGVAPLHFLARWIAERVGCTQVTLLIGARSQNLLVCSDKLAKLGADMRIATDDGSTGCCGFVTDLLNEYIAGMEAGSSPTVYTCGPMPMLRAVSRITKERGLWCEVSTEAKMACGVGACMSCVVRVRSGGTSKYVRSCHEGPVFDANEIVWE